MGLSWENVQRRCANDPQNELAERAVPRVELRIIHADENHVSAGQRAFEGFPRAVRSDYSASMELDLSWLLHVEASGKAAHTLKSYRMGITDFARSLDAPLETATPDDLRKWMVNSRRRGLSPVTVSNRLTIVKIFYKWAAEERGLIDVARGVRAPKAPETITEVLSRRQQRDLLATCRGRHPIQLRDTAILSVLLDGGLRAAECVGLTLDDVNLPDKTLIVRGKGGRKRNALMRTQTALTIDRYLNTRADDHAALWLTRFGDKPLRYPGLAHMIKKRGADAGIPSLHPHMFRHTWASEYRRAGGSEGNLMILGGWLSREMLDRYGRVDAESRALEEGRRVLSQKAT